MKLKTRETVFLRKNVLDSDQSYFGFSNPVETEWWNLDLESQQSIKTESDNFIVKLEIHPDLKVYRRTTY